MLQQYKREKYTGVNRCQRCTVVNLGIAGVISVIAWTLLPALGMTVFGLSVLLIYFRGYLVPGTPTLTKRYFPESLLSLFRKSSGSTANDSHLVDPPAIEELPFVMGTGDGIGLEPAFEEDLHEELGRFGSDPEQALSGLLPYDEFEVSGSEEGEIQVVVPEEGEMREIASWPNESELLVDTAILSLLAERVTNWGLLTPHQQLNTSSQVRALLESCPLCKGSLYPFEAKEETCCSIIRRAGLECRDCGKTVLTVAQ